jgi:hypothetical protein
MNEYFGPIDSLVKEIMGNIRFLDKLVTKTRVISGIVGIVGTVGLLIAIVLLLKK